MLVYEIGHSCPGQYDFTFVMCIGIKNMPEDDFSNRLSVNNFCDMCHYISSF